MTTKPNRKKIGSNSGYTKVSNDLIDDPEVSDPEFRLRINIIRYMNTKEGCKSRASVPRLAGDAGWGLTKTKATLKLLNNRNELISQRRFKRSTRRQITKALSDGKYTKIPNEIIDHNGENLSDSEFRLIVLVLRWTNLKKGNVAWPKISNIIMVTHWSKSKTNRTVSALTNRGLLISVATKNRHGLRVFERALIAAWAPTSKLSNLSVATVSPGDSLGVSPGDRTIVSPGDRTIVPPRDYVRVSPGDSLISTTALQEQNFTIWPMESSLRVDPSAIRAGHETPSLELAKSTNPGTGEMELPVKEFPVNPVEELHGKSVEELPVNPVEEFHGKSVEELPVNPVEEFHGKSVEELPVIPVEELHGKSVEEFSVNPVEELHGKSVEEFSVNPVEELHGKSVDSNHGKSVEEFSVNPVEELHGKSVDSNHGNPVEKRPEIQSAKLPLESLGIGHSTPPPALEPLPPTANTTDPASSACALSQGGTAPSQGAQAEPPALTPEQEESLVDLFASMAASRDKNAAIEMAQRRKMQE